MKKYEYIVDEYDSDDNPKGYTAIDIQAHLNGHGEDGYCLRSVNVVGTKIYVFLEREEE